MTVLPSAYQILCGTLPYKVASLHDKYEPVIRIGPNALSYIVEEAWNDIYGRQVELKRDETKIVKVMDEVPGMIAVDTEGHARMRRNLSHGFSEKNSEKGSVDIVKWLNLTTFDIIGDLTFGESFGCLETSNMHSAKEIQMRHSELTKVKLLKRLESQDPRPDFLSHVQHHIGAPSGMTIQELLSSMTIFVIAGAETTASLLSGVTYYLLANPFVLSKLQTEVRKAFNSEDEITIVSVNGSTYMFAILNEALRLYQPSPESFNRLIPPSGCDIAGRFVPGNTSVAVSQWSANHSAANFARVDEFIPERWMGKEEFRNDKRKVVQPFSAGPRNCIGQNLAFAEMRLILARLMWNFDMEHTEESQNWMKDQKIWFTFEKRPMMVKLKPVARPKLNVLKI